MRGGCIDGMFWSAAAVVSLTCGYAKRLRDQETVPHSALAALTRAEDRRSQCDLSDGANGIDQGRNEASPTSD